MRTYTDYSLHTHTIGFDGHDHVEHMALAAELNGIKTLGFSNHFIVHPNIKKSKMYEFAELFGYDKIYSDDAEKTIKKFQEHYDAICEVQKNYPKVQLLRGMEMDLFQYDGWTDMANYAIETLKPDYVIGAMHFVDHGDKVLNVHDLINAGNESKKLLQEYYENFGDKLTDLVYCGLKFKINFFAHFNLPRKVGLTDLELEKFAIEKLSQLNIPIELNTSLIKNKQYSNNLENAPEFQEIARLNIPVILSDDAHRIPQLGQNFQTVAEAAQKNGITNLCLHADMLEKFIGIKSR